MSSFRLILKNLAAIFTSNAISVFTELVQPAIFLRSYGTTLYADWLVLTSAVSYLATLNFGLQTFVNQDLAVRYNRGEREGYHVQQSTALRALIGITLVAAVGCLVIFLLPIERLLNLSISHAAAAWSLYFISLQILVGALIFSYFAGAFMGVGLAHRGNNWNNIQRFSNALVLCGLAALKLPLSVLAFGQFALYIVLLAGLLIDLKSKAADIFPTLRYWDKAALIAMLKPSAYFGLIFWSNFLGFQLPIIVLRRMLGPGPVVVFSLGRKIFSMGRQILTGLTQSLGPEITRIFGQGDWPRLYKLYDYSERIIFAAIAMLNVPLFLFSPLLLHLWLHKPGLFDLQTYTLLGLVGATICIKEHKVQFQYSTNTHIELGQITTIAYLSMFVVSLPAIHFFKLPGLVGTWFLAEAFQTVAIVRLNKRLFAAHEALSTGYLTRLTAILAIGFGAGYLLLRHTPASALLSPGPLGLEGLISVLVIAVSWYVFGLSEMSGFLQAKLRSRFRPG